MKISIEYCDPTKMVLQGGIQPVLNCDGTILQDPTRGDHSELSECRLSSNEQFQGEDNFPSSETKLVGNQLPVVKAVFKIYIHAGITAPLAAGGCPSHSSSACTGIINLRL